MQADWADRRMEAGVARPPTRRRLLCLAREYPPVCSASVRMLSYLNCVPNWKLCVPSGLATKATKADGSGP
jgi:hypothetical protein